MLTEPTLNRLHLVAEFVQIHGGDGAAEYAEGLRRLGSATPAEQRKMIPRAIPPGLLYAMCRARERNRALAEAARGAPGPDPEGVAAAIAEAFDRLSRAAEQVRRFLGCLFDAASAPEPEDDASRTGPRERGPGRAK